MKVLIDTSVWSQALRRQNATAGSLPESRAVNLLKELIHDGRVALLGPVRQELLSGVKAKVQFEKLQKILSVFPDESLSTADYELAAQSSTIVDKQACRARIPTSSFVRSPSTGNGLF
jgi:predicted nucleic acid-binding protein